MSRNRCFSGRPPERQQGERIGLIGRFLSSLGRIGCAAWVRAAILVLALAGLMAFAPGRAPAQPPPPAQPALNDPAPPPADDAPPGDVQVPSTGDVGTEPTQGTPPVATAPAAPNCPAQRELCVQADRSGGIDLKTGVATLEGNVRGVVRSRSLSFRGETLKAFRNGGREWVRLVLDQDVRLRQGSRLSDSDHGVLERDEIRLTGNVRIEQDDLSIEGNDAVIRSGDNRTTVRGLPDQPLMVVLRRALLVEEGGPASDGGDTTQIHAQKAVVEENPRRVTLTGDVHIEQSNERLRLDAQQVTLFFNAASALDSFRAEGKVIITQPERRITADYAQSRNQLRTILLVGHASMQQKGAFDLKSDRMEVYSDASKGIMQSQDKQKPITLSLDLAGNQNYGLTQAGMLKLSNKGTPPNVLEKIAPLIGKTFPSRAAFREALAQRLTRREADAHLETILSNAR